MSSCPLQVVILAAGLGTRLGRPLPKPLTPLHDGRSILEHQVHAVRATFGPLVPITLVVGFMAETVALAAPAGVHCVPNSRYARTNTAKSLLTALESVPAGGVLWLNGDVVFDRQVLELVRPAIEAEETLVCVNTAAVGEEEVKYTVDRHGFVAELSKTVADGLGEAVGINYVRAEDRCLLAGHLAACADGDYFERGLETAALRNGLRIRPLDISQFPAVEVDVEADLIRANAELLRPRLLVE